jgi:hypothetical protein
MPLHVMQLQEQNHIIYSMCCNLNSMDFTAKYELQLLSHNRDGKQHSYPIFLYIWHILT